MKLLKQTLIGMIILMVLLQIVSAQYSSGLEADVPHSNIRVTFLNQDPDPVEPGEYVNLRWRVENFGAKDIKDMTFRLDLEPPFSLDDPADNVKKVGTLGVRQVGEDSLVLHWRVRVAEDALEGDNEVRLYYETPIYGVKLDPYVVRIQTRDVYLAVNSIEVLPERVKPGEEAQVQVEIQNLADSSVDEVKLTLDLVETQLATIGSTSEKIIKKLTGGEIKTVPFELIVDPQAASKVHHIPLNIQYTDKFGEEFTVNTYFGLIVDQPPEYIVNLEETTLNQANTKGTLTFSVSNIGVSDINFVTMEILPSAQYEIISNAQMYLGNLESDDYETAEFEIFSKPKTEGEMQVTLKLSYKDSFNKNYEKEYQIPIKIYSAKDAIKYGLANPPSYKGILFLLVVIGGVGYWWYRKKKKAKLAKKK